MAANNAISLIGIWALVTGLGAGAARGQDCNQNNAPDSAEVNYPRKVYWTGGNFIFRTDRDGQNLEQVSPFLGSGLTFEVAVGAESMCWSFGSSTTFLRCGGLDGSSSVTVASTNPFPITAIAIDKRFNRVFYASNQSIYYAGLTGGGGTVISTESQVGDLAIDRANDYLYWTLPQDGLIRRRKILGAPGPIETFYASSGSPWGIDVDAGLDRAYFSDGDDDSIRWIRLQNPNTQWIIAQNTGTVREVRLDVGEGKVYWTDLGGMLFRNDLDVGSPEQLFDTTSPPGFDLLYPLEDCNMDGVPDECQLDGNDCNGNLVPDDCEDDCDGNGVPDVCEPDCDNNGIADTCEILAGQAADCNDNGILDTCDVEGALFWVDVTTKIVFRAALDSYNPYGVTLLDDNVVPRGFAVDAEAGYVYWLNNTGNSLNRANLEFKDNEILGTFPSHTVYDLDLDLINGKIYLTLSNEVIRVNLDGSGQETVVASGGNVRGVVVDAAGGKVYWSQTTPLGEVRRANLDGTGIESLVGGLLEPRGLDLDLGAGKLYWTDISTSRVGRCNLDGTGQELLIQSAAGAVRNVALDLANGKMYLASFGQDVSRANLDGTDLETLACCYDAFLAIVPQLTDCDGDDVPDECEPDCNGNGTADDCDIFTPFFADGFDPYSENANIHGLGGWTGWDNNPALGGTVRSTQSFSYPQSLEIDGPDDTVQAFSGATSGSWQLTTWAYFEEFAELDSYFILLNTYNEGGPYNWSTEINFHSGFDWVRSSVDGSVLDVPLSDLADRWFEIRIDIDLDLDRQTVYIDGIELVTKSWSNGASGDGAVNIGAVDLFANDSDAIYYDDVRLTQVTNDCNFNGEPDECDADCDGDGLPNDCAIAQGDGDCNANGIPDPCEITVEPLIVWSNWLLDSLWASPIGDFSPVQLLEGGPFEFSGLAIDPADRKLYWSFRDDQEIIRSELDGSDPEVAFELPEGGAVDLAIDATEREIYLRSTGEGDIYRANLDGSELEYFDTTNFAEFIAIDSIGGYAYWTTGNFCCVGTLERRSVSGTDPIEVLFDDLEEPGGVAIDPYRQKVYWTENSPNNQRIRRSNLDGTQREDLISVANRPYGIAVDALNGKLYFSLIDSITQIYRANLDGSDLELLGDSVDSAYRLEILVPMPDCDGNSIPDVCDVWAGAGDCNFTLQPDVCELAGNDCDGNNAPDECQPDCDGDGTINTCAITGGASDCDGDDLPDSCAVAVPDRVYWTESDGIHFANQDGSGSALLISTPVAAVALTVNVTDDSVYWSEPEEDRIGRARLDGTEVSYMPFPALRGVLDLAIDPMGERVYWVSESRDGVFRSSLIGGDAEQIVSGQTGMRALELDLVNGKVYWASADGFHRADLGGANVQDLGGPSDVNDLTVDTVGTYIFFTSPSGVRYYDIPCMVTGNVDTSHGEGHGLEVDVENERIRWVASAGIYESGWFGGIDTLVVPVGSSARMLSSTHPPTDCNANGLPDSCDLDTEGDCNGNGIVDTCDIDGGESDCDGNLLPDQCDIDAGAADCNSDGVLDVCQLGGTSYVYWAANGPNDISRALLDGNGIEDLVTSGLSTPIVVAIDEDAGKLYWTDTGTDNVRRANLDGTDVEVVVGDLNDPVGLGLDVSSGKMYFTEGAGQAIKRSNLDGSGVETLFTTATGSPRDLVLDLDAGMMYWSDTGDSVITRANLDGTAVEALVTSGLANPRGIGLDLTGGKMYWVDPGTSKLQRANLDGTGVEDLLTAADGLDTPLGLAVDVAAGQVYWSDSGASQGIFRANLDGSGMETVISFAGNEGPVGVTLQLAGALNDCNGNGTLDSCDIASGAEEDTNGNGIPDSCEIPPVEAPYADDRLDIDGTFLACSGDGDCPGLSVCRDGACYVPTQRFLSLAANPANDGIAHRLRVSLDTTSAGTVVLGFAALGAPVAVLGPGPNQYLPASVVPLASASAVDWNAEMAADGDGYLVIGDCEISPGRTYLVQAIRADEDPADESRYSDPLALPTSDFGDATGGGAVATPPNGTSNLVDVFASVQAFQNNQGGPKHWFDVEPFDAGPNFVWNLADTFTFVQAFQQVAYGGSDPDGCP